MEIRVEYRTSTHEGDEFFDSTDEAIDYLMGLEEEIAAEDEEEYMEESEMTKEESEAEEFAYLPDRVSVSKVQRSYNKTTICSELAKYKLHGFEITYEGKTGYTLERK